MTKTRRQLILLGALLVAVLVVARVAGLIGGGPAETGRQSSNRAAANRGQARADVPVVDVKLELLEQAREAPSEATRNPFRFQSRAASVDAAPAPPQTTETAPPLQPQGPPPPPPILLRFIGFVEPAEGTGRVGVLSDGRGNVFYAKEGDIIEGRYRVLRIGVDSADLAYLDGRGRQTIRLSGQ